MRAGRVGSHKRRGEEQISGLAQGKPAHRRCKKWTTGLLWRLRVGRDPVSMRAGLKATEGESAREGTSP
jgi:hypothetical protein